MEEHIDQWEENSFYIYFFFNVIIYLREREKTAREKGRESYEGLHPTNLRTWSTPKPGVNSSTSSATQAPLNIYLLGLLCVRNYSRLWGYNERMEVSPLLKQMFQYLLFSVFVP